MDVPLQDVLIGCYCKQTEEQLQVLQIIYPVNVIMQCTRSQQKLNVWEVLLKYCGKAITVTVQNLLST